MKSGKRENGILLQFESKRAICKYAQLVKENAAYAKSLGIETEVTIEQKRKESEKSTDKTFPE